MSVEIGVLILQGPLITCTAITWTVIAVYGSRLIAALIYCLQNSGGTTLKT